MKLPGVTVVGAGFFGSTVARLLAELGFFVEVLDEREHIGGNAYDYIDENSHIRVHKYGSHIFHTNNKVIWKFVNRFAEFSEYEHSVKAKVKNRDYTLPININTINEIYNTNISPLEAENFLRTKTIDRQNPENIEEYCQGRFGTDIYETLIKGYTQKQWGKSPEHLPREIIQRIPLRMNFDNRYFDDEFQGLPRAGYTTLFENLLDHKRITMSLNEKFLLSSHSTKFSHLTIYCGALDSLFDYEFGELEWRNVVFEYEKLDCDSYQGAAVINYPEIEIPYTRIHEFKYLYPENLSQTANKTIIAKEYAVQREKGVSPYYPIRTSLNLQLQEKYEKALKSFGNLYAGGRLGSFLYLDMHMAIGQGIKFANAIAEKFGLDTSNLNL
jgi:UDP-galactopyranose mutase